MSEDEPPIKPRVPVMNPPLRVAVCAYCRRVFEASRLSCPYCEYPTRLNAPERLP